MSKAPSPSRSAMAMPCEIASSAPNPHRWPTSEKVRSPLLRKATLGTASLGNCASSRLHSRPENVVDRKSTRLNSSHSQISYAVFCLKKKKNNTHSRSAFAHLKIHFTTHKKRPIERHAANVTAETADETQATIGDL